MPDKKPLFFRYIGTISTNILFLNGTINDRNDTIHSPLFVALADLP